MALTLLRGRLDLWGWKILAKQETPLALGLSHLLLATEAVNLVFLA